MDQGELPLNIYMDLSKAFDTIDHATLIQKLYYYGISGKALSLIENYLTDRRQYVQINETKSSLLPIVTGVPQGSILGPLLFIIYINDISQSSEYFQFINYADDTTLFIALNSISNNYISDALHINNEIKKITIWLKVNKLSLNLSKTKIIAFHSANKCVTLPKLLIDNTEIEYVNEFSILGVVVDKNLNWTPHINHIIKKISKSICILNKLKHYLPEQTLKTIYNSLINSHINYGILCWGYKTNRLLKLQKKAIRIVCHTKYNAHTQPLFKRLNILTIQDILIRKLYKFYFKMQHNQLPNYFSNNFLQQSTHSYNTRNDLYELPYTRHKFAEHSIRFQLPKELNKKINCILEKIHTHSEFGYSLYIKRYLISKYETTCQLSPCYICNN
jgi:hypothetical protein